MTASLAMWSGLAAYLSHNHCSSGKVVVLWFCFGCWLHLGIVPMPLHPFLARSWHSIIFPSDPWWMCFFFCSLLGLESKLHSFLNLFDDHGYGVGEWIWVSFNGSSKGIEPTTRVMRVEPLYLQSPPKVMCTLEPFYWCIASDTEDPDEWQLNWTKQWWDICFQFWMWGLSLTLEELFSDSCQQAQDFKRVYSTFSCHLEPKLEGETGSQLQGATWFDPWWEPIMALLQVSCTTNITQLAQVLQWWPIGACSWAWVFSTCVCEEFSF